MKIKRTSSKLEKKARRGHRGYPLATVAFYGPDASRASKVAVSIIPNETDDVAEIRRWLSESEDLRRDSATGAEIVKFLDEHGVKSVVMSPGIIGCPHEEGIDYQEGHVCPQCVYWMDRDRWSGEKLPEQ